MRRSLFLSALALVVSLLVGSCVRLPSPSPSDTRYYLLRSDPPADTAASTPGLRLGLRTPSLAEYLDTQRLVLRRGPNEIHFSEAHQWGEALGPALNRAVALHLEGQPGVQSVEGVPWPRGADFDYVLQLRVLRFEGVGPPPPGPDADDDAPLPEGHSQMAVGWTVLGPAGDSIRTRGQTRHRVAEWTVTDYAGLVARLDTSLGVLADDIHRRLMRLSDPES